MSKKYSSILLLFFIYSIIAGLLGVFTDFPPWQILILLCPPLIFQIIYKWFSPYPIYRGASINKIAPIEDINNPARKYIWLNGMWEFKLLKENRWHRVNIPHCWSSIPGLEFYEGIGIYRRLFSIPENWSMGKIFLHFRSINYKAMIYLDGRELIVHEGGYTPFSIDITDRVRQSKNREQELEVKVSNILSATSVPNVTEWANDGGIYREVYIETMREIYIKDIQIFVNSLSLNEIHNEEINVVTDEQETNVKQSNKIDSTSKTADMSIFVQIENIDLRQKNYKIEIFSPTNQQVYQYFIEDWTMQTITHNFSLPYVMLWSPETPVIYTCKISILGSDNDVLSKRFGVKKFEIAGNNTFFLNGCEIKLRGINRIEESIQFKRSQSLVEIKEDLQLVKDCGFNTIKLRGFPNHTKILDICDEIGLMVLEELPVWRASSFDLVNPDFQRNAQDQLKEIISRDMHHPSIIMWGIANNVASHTDESRWFIEKLVTIIKSMDTRLYYIVSEMVKEDVCTDLVNVYGFDMSFNIKTPLDTREYISKWHEKVGNSPLIISSFGAPGVKQGVLVRRTETWTEEKQADFIQEQLRVIDSDTKIAGWFLSSLADFRDSGSFLSPIPFFRLTGLLTHKREKKLSYQVVQTYLKEGKNIVAETSVTRSSRVPIPAKLLLLLLLIFAFGVCLKFPEAVFSLAFSPKQFISIYHNGLLVLFFVTIFTSLSCGIIVAKFLKAMPTNFVVAMKIPLLRILSLILRRERITFASTYVFILFGWVFSGTLLSIVSNKITFSNIAHLTAACSLPDSLFVLAAFLKIPLLPILVLFLVWKFYLYVVTIGIINAVIFLFFGPFALIVFLLILLETNFKLWRFLKDMF